MNKNIKYLIEEIVNFNPVDYSDDDYNLVDEPMVDNIVKKKPKDIAELKKLIVERVKENKFGNDKLIFPDLSDINVFQVTDMFYLFATLCPIEIPQSISLEPHIFPDNIPVKLDLSSWNVSNVRSMLGMFAYCPSLIELNLSGWDTSNVTDMSYMFSNSGKLKELDISSFDTSNVKNMKNMFDNCYSLRKLDVSHFNTPNVEDMSYMFEGCILLKALDLSNFDTSNVKLLDCMFRQCFKLKTLNITELILPSLIINEYDPEIFNDTPALKRKPDIRILISENLVKHVQRFNPADYSNDESDLIILDDMNKLLITPETKEELVNLIKERIRENPLKPYLLDICTSLITDMSKLFYNYENIKVLDLRTWDTSNVTDMSNMFAFCKSVTKLDLSSWNVSNVKTMECMFAYCYELREVNLSDWDTSNVEDMCGMFASNKQLTEIDLTSFDTSNVKTMEYMFGLCQELKTIKLGDRWNTRNVENTERMFHICQELTNIDFSNFYMTNNKQFKGSTDLRKCNMFWGCKDSIKRRFKKLAKI